LVEAEPNGDARRMLVGKAVEEALVALLTASEDDQLRVRVVKHSGNGRGDQIETLLLGEARHEADQRRRRIDDEAGLRLEGGLAAGLAAQIAAVVVEGQMGIPGRVPLALVDAVQDPA